MVLRTKNFNILGVHWKIRLLGGILKNQYIGGDRPRKGGWLVQFVDLRGGLARKRAWCFWGGGDTPVPTMIILSHLELLRKDLPKLNSSILMEIVTIPIGQVYALPHKSLAFCKKFLWTSFFVFNCILLRQAISLKKKVVLSVKFTILFSRSPVCIPLILLSALMRLAGTSAAVLHNILDSRHHCRTHTGVTGSNRSYRINSRLF